MTDSRFQRCLTARVFICSETTVKDGWRASFSQYGFHPVRNTAGHHDHCGPDVQGGIVHCHLCDGGKNRRTALTECPGVSTQPFSSFSAVNVNRSQAGWPVQPVPAQQPSSVLTDGRHLQAVTAGDAESGIFPVTLRRSPSATGIFSGRNATSCCPEKKYAPPAFRPAHPQGQAVTLRRHPVYHIAVMTGVSGFHCSITIPGRYISRR